MELELLVFDHLYNVVAISRNDVVVQKWINKHYEYHTLTTIYHGASNAKEEAELQASTGFIKIDKNNIINMKYIDQFTKDGVVVNGLYYKMSRAKLAHLKRQLRKYIPNSH
jgi:hypothetical protein